MIRNAIRGQLFKNKELFYRRRQDLGNLYINNNSILKEFNISIPDYKNEYNILTQLKHPNIITIQDSFYKDANFYTVMPYYNKGDLLYNIFNESILSTHDILNITRKLIKPIAYLHHNKHVHLDIKLENYVAGDKYAYILIDFEHTKPFNKGYYELQQLSQIVGTNKYMAPEIRALHYGPTSDVYSLGKVLYMIIARRYCDTADIDWKPIRTKLPHLEELLIATLQHNHRLRPTIFDLYRDVNALLYRLC